jgi:ABC-type sugar transport system substrate-binding protein
MGLPGSSPAIERDRGFSDGLKKYTDIHIAARVYGDWLKDMPKSNLQGYPCYKKCDALFAHNDVMALGTREGA